MFNLNSNKIKLNNTLNFGYSYRYLEKQKHNLNKGLKQRPKYLPNQSVMSGQLFGLERGHGDERRSFVKYRIVGSSS